MNRIINPTQLQSSVVKVSYKVESGTGFFVSTNTILTAYHLFLDQRIDESAILLNLEDGSEQNCSVLFTDEEYDICLLKCNIEHNFYLPLNQTPIRINDNWESYGYPYYGERDGLRIFGSVNQIVEGEKYDFLLNCDNIDSEYNYEGFSGSPIVSAGRVIGVVLKQLDDKIGAISINKIADELSDYGIRIYNEELTNEIPSQLESDISDIISNYDVINRLNKVIQVNGNWILLEGKPGTGKTVNIASFLSEENCVVLGKYFTKVPNDDKPKSLRISKESFFNWIEESISLTITGSLPAKSNELLEKRIELFTDYLKALGEHLEENDKIGLFFIDGLDEVSNLKDFLGIIPENLPERVRIILSCTSRDILPVSIRNHIDESRIVLVSPLELSQCEYFIQRKLSAKKLDYDNIQKIAIKSEGHPLYLHYLIDYVLNSTITNKKDELDYWIESIPVIGGNIENYYNTIWEDIFEDSSKLWICLILSQLRHPIAQSDLINILPEDIRRNFYSAIPKISHLIKGREKQEIYHNSFKYYILKQVPLYIKDCNDLIAKFCEQNPDNIYSITNVIYHYGLSNNPIKSVSRCNQEWADKLANKHVEPDLIIYDIKKTIELSIEHNCTTDLIRLLLLLQRIDFRYNSVLVEYAYELALALIANKKFSEAIKYLVRRNTLLISIKDAVHFLQHFHENRAQEECELLKSAIEKEYRILLDKGFNTKSIESSIFIVKAQAIILGGNNSEQSHREFLQYLNLVRRFDSTDGSTSDGIKYIRDYCFSWYTAYLLKFFGEYAEIEKILEKIPDMVIDESWSTNYAKSIWLFEDGLNGYNLIPLKDRSSKSKLVSDVEFLTEKFNYNKTRTNQETLILSLLRCNSRPDLLRQVMKDYLVNEEDLSFRNENEVDFERLSYERLCLRNNCLGFLADSEEFKIHRKAWIEKSWEGDLQRLIEEISFVEGRAYYYKASGQLAKKLAIVQIELNEIVKSISFTFDFRSYWESSYQLPEQIFPLIFSKLISLLFEFNLDSLDKFLSALATKSSNQFGLYTEGFRKSINHIIQTLIALKYDKEKVILFAEIWQSHVLSGVQNRWERTEDLLKIYEIYGILNYDKRAEEVFQEMLNTSMGPGWYKEDQFTLINSALKNLDFVPNHILQDFATLFDYASGEMTFQRYVKYDKEEFIGSLILSKQELKALEYYKSEILPSPNVLVQNAESSSFDAPRVGDGYCLGARSINEASGIIQVLKRSKCNPYLKFALCQIFTINDDTFRYINKYGMYLAFALNEIDLLNDGNISNFCSTTSELIADPSLGDTDREILLDVLFKNLSKANSDRLQNYLKTKNIIGKLEHNDDSSKSTKLDENDNFDLFNQSLMTVEDDSKSERVIEGLELFRKEGKSIWFNNWSHSSRLAKKNIKSLFNNENCVLQHLKDDILKFNDEYWRICDELLWFMEGILNEERSSEILNIIKEHFHWIIRPEEKAKEKYSWIGKEVVERSSDSLIAELVVWHLNHPYSDIKNRTEEALKSIVPFSHSIFEALFSECLTNKPVPSTELCSILLNEISKTNSLTLKQYLENNSHLLKQISGITHLSIKKNLLDVGINLSLIGYSKLYTEIVNSIPNTVVLSGEVFFEEPHLVSIQERIDSLNLEFLVDKRFCIMINQLIDDYCSPLDKSKVVLSDRYLRRSFYNQEGISGRYNYLIKYAFNNAISHRVSFNNIDVIYDIINN